MPAVLQKSKRVAVRRHFSPAPTGTASIKLSLLNCFELTCDCRLVAVPANSQRLLAVLALAEGSLQRTFVAGQLWTHSSEERSISNLRSALWRLPQLGIRLVESAGSRLRLSPQIEVDVRKATALARSLISRGQELDLTDSDAVRVELVADVLPDWYEDWVLIEQERFRQLRLHALETLCEQLIAAGRYAVAVDAGMAAVAGEPLRESAQRVLIKAHLCEGNGNEAVKQYAAYSRRLRAELGIEPSPQLKNLVSHLVTT
jgi:DNA-binding SARP family transcriptional activator